MKSNKWIIAGALVALLLVVSGITYAYFYAKITGNEKTSTINLEAGTLEIVLDGGNTIVANSIIPSSTPFATKEFTVIGNNDSNGNMPYNINIVVDNNTYTEGSITYTLESTNTSNNGKVVTPIEYQVVDDTLTIGSGYFTIGRNLTHTYTIKFYFLDDNTDQSVNMRANFAAHIEISGERSTDLAPKHWRAADNTTLLGLIKENSILHTDETGMSIPGQDIAETDEGLRAAEDDYGFSYYYRGAVQNNYVVFANKCWKIVRVDGNGNIKLFLWNNNGTDCSTNAADTSAFNSNTVTYNKDAGGTGNLYETASGVGFMYGKPDGAVAFSDNNTGAQDNITDSTILTNLKTWYDTTFDTANTTNYTNLLADVIWCGDKSIDSGDGFGESGHGGAYFMAYKRLYLNNSIKPSLICPDASSASGTSETIKNTSRYTAYSNTDSNNSKGNGMLKTAVEGSDPTEYKYYKIGLITPDEVVFAGGKSNLQNSSYYLYTGSTYWAMTPYSFSGSYSYDCLVYSTGILAADASVFSYGLRPSVALNYDVKATYNTGGTDAPGTVNNPYVVTVN